MQLFSETSISSTAGLTPDKSTALPEDSHANPIQPPESEKEMTTTVRSGLKCLESFKRLRRPGLLAKTLLASSAWTAGVYSPEYSLTWKMQGIARKHILFRLSLSERRTGETGFGLLPTATTSNATGDGEHGTGGPNLQTKIAGLLPTPNAADGQGGRQRKAGTYSETGQTDAGKVQVGLSMRLKLLPTPASRDYKGENSPSHIAKERGHHDQLPNRIAMVGNGKSIGMKLQPEFVEHLMGFPPGWTEI